MGVCRSAGAGGTVVRRGVDHSGGVSGRVQPRETGSGPQLLRVPLRDQRQPPEGHTDRTTGAH